MSNRGARLGYRLRHWQLRRSIVFGCGTVYMQCWSFVRFPAGRYSIACDLGPSANAPNPNESADRMSNQPGFLYWCLPRDMSIVYEPQVGLSGFWTYRRVCWLGDR